MVSWVLLCPARLQLKCYSLLFLGDTIAVSNLSFQDLYLFFVVGLLDPYLLSLLLNLLLEHVDLLLERAHRLLQHSVLVAAVLQEALSLHGEKRRGLLQLLLLLKLGHHGHWGCVTDVGRGLGVDQGGMGGSPVTGYMPE